MLNSVQQVFINWANTLENGLEQTRARIATGFLVLYLVSFLLVYLISGSFSVFVTKDFYLLGAGLSLLCLVLVRFSRSASWPVILFITCNSAFIIADFITKGFNSFMAYNVWLVVYIMLAYVCINKRAGMWVLGFYVVGMAAMGIAYYAGINLLHGGVSPHLQVSVSISRIMSVVALGYLLTRMVDAFEVAKVAQLEANAELEAANQELQAQQEELSQNLDMVSMMAVQLELSKQRFELAEEGSAAGIWDWDIANDNLYTSDLCRNIIGFPAGVQISLPEWMSRLHPDDVPLVQQRMQPVLEGKTDILESEHRFMHPERGAIWTFNRGKCAYNEQGQPLRMVGTMIDIDRQKTIEAELRLKEQEMAELNVTLAEANAELQAREEELTQNLDMVGELVAKLEASEQRFKLAVDGSEAGIFDLNLATDQLFASPVLVKILGFDCERRLTMADLLQQIHPEDKDQVTDKLKAVLNKEEPLYECVYRVQHEQKGVIWVSSRGSCAFNELGDPVRFIGTVTDISQIKQAEVQLALANHELQVREEELRQNLDVVSDLVQKLETSEQRFELAVEGSEVGIWDINYVTGELYISSLGRTVLGLPETGPVLMHEWTDRVLAEDKGQAGAAHQRVLKGETNVYYAIYRIQHPARGIVWVSSRGMCSYDENGKAVRMVGTVADITSAKQAEEAQRQSQAILEEAQRIARAASFETNLVTGVTTASPMLAEMLEVEPERSVADYNWPEIIHPEDRDRVMKEWSYSFNNRVPYEVEYRAHTSSGRLIYLRSKAAVMTDELTGELKMLGTTQDITQDVLQRQELQAAKEQAEELAQAKAAFLSTMSHEIRTPLNAVIGLSEILLLDDPKPEQRVNLQTLSYSGNLLLSLINDILDYSKIDAGKVQFEQVEFNLNETLEQLVRMLGGRAQEKQISLVLQSTMGLNITIISDLTRLTQVLTNLVGNAIKFTDKGGVTISFRIVSEDATGLRLRFEVKDTGIGIPADKVDSIFETFTQATASTNRQYGGTGLGLAISKRLVELQGGAIGVTSELGQGSIFWFELPVTKGKPLQKVQTQSLADGQVLPELGNVQVLLVDDNEINIMVTRKFLERWGAQVVPARDGREAVEKALATRYDLVLMDLRMPVMDGYEATAALRAQPDEYYKTLPIIALTASIPANMYDDIIAHGFNDYMTKPFHPNDLFAVLHRALSPEAVK